MSVLSTTRVPGHLPRALQGATLDQVRQEVAARADLVLPDTVLPLKALRITEDGLVEVPQIGRLSLTTWSRTQLARMLGIRWDKWFANRLASPAERKEEIDRRLSRLPGEWKIRSQRRPSSDPSLGEGVLRAFVSPNYTPIDDVRVFDRLSAPLALHSDSLRFIRQEVTDTHTYYVAVTLDEVQLGNVDPDVHHVGFVIANSEVGASALSILEYVWRLVCTNGLVVLSEGRKLFYRIHRATSDESIERDLAFAMARLPERWRLATARLEGAREDRIEEPEATLAGFLADPTVRTFTEPVLAAYRAEPVATRFGLIQAVTRVARDLPPDQRFVLERFAGGLLASGGAA